jgi:hypothetical protein
VEDIGTLPEITGLREGGIDQEYVDSLTEVIDDLIGPPPHALGGRTGPQGCDGPPGPPFHRSARVLPVSSEVNEHPCMYRHSGPATPERLEARQRRSAATEGRLAELWEKAVRSR